MGWGPTCSHTPPHCFFKDSGEPMENGSSPSWLPVLPPVSMGLEETWQKGSPNSIVWENWKDLGTNPSEKLPLAHTLYCLLSFWERGPAPSYHHFPAKQCRKVLPPGSEPLQPTGTSQIAKIPHGLEPRMANIALFISAGRHWLLIPSLVARLGKVKLSFQGL